MKYNFVILFLDGNTGVHRIVLFQSEVGLVFTERLAFTDREKNWEEDCLS